MEPSHSGNNNNEARGTLGEDRHGLFGVKAEANKLLGDEASEWMARPSRFLDGMAPSDLAASPDGARAVLHELRRASRVLRATRMHRKP